MMMRTLPLTTDGITLDKFEFIPDVKIQYNFGFVTSDVTIVNNNQSDVFVVWNKHVFISVTPPTAIVPAGTDQEFRVTVHLNKIKDLNPKLMIQLRTCSIGPNDLPAEDIRNSLRLQQQLCYGNCHVKNFYLVFERFSQSVWWDESIPTYGRVPYESLPAHLQRVFTWPPMPPPPQSGCDEVAVEME
ncbi:hypothetical protein B9Z55_028864 [Caenorhabditis nigoni]|uniref:MSP domain-containing protein n=1 Tax=Caenorhabditis nigoni TaxID=1611254 RepID=A0A2G5SA22_9PELO|nr:hypothetical protein B9Z55_028864 [Caenorhabditis nigoni]